jgi:hypothetical protein
MQAMAPERQEDEQPEEAGRHDCRQGQWHGSGWTSVWCEYGVCACSGSGGEYEAEASRSDFGRLLDATTVC